MKSMTSAALTLCAATLFTTLPVQAKELPKSTVEISGATGFNVGANIVTSDGTDSVKTSVSSFNLQSRYYFQDNVAFSFGFNRIDTDIEIASDHAGSTTTMLIPGLSINKPLSDDVNLILSAGFIISGLRQSFNNSAGDAQGKGIQMGVELQTFLSDRASINFGGQINKHKVKNETNDISANLTDRLFNVGLSFYFGN